MINIRKAKINKMEMVNAIIPIPRFFIIQNSDNGLYITGGSNNSSQVTQENPRSNFNRQMWTFTPVDRGNPKTSYYIVNQSINMVIALENPTLDEREPLVVSMNTETEDRQWFVNVYEDNKDEVFFVNRFSGMVMDNFDRRSDPGNRQEQFSYSGNSAQRFRIFIPIS